MPKECPPGKIRNPSTGRCIKKDGPTAKKLKLYSTPSDKKSNDVKHKKVIYKYKWVCPIKYVDSAEEKSCKITKTILTKLKAFVKKDMKEMNGGLKHHLDVTAFGLENVTSIIVEVKGDLTKPFLLITAVAKSELDEQQLDFLETEIEGDMSDGWGDKQLVQTYDFGTSCHFIPLYGKIKRV